MGTTLILLKIINNSIIILFTKDKGAKIKVEDVQQLVGVFMKWARLSLKIIKFIVLCVDQNELCLYSQSLQKINYSPGTSQPFLNLNYIDLIYKLY